MKRISVFLGLALLVMTTTMGAKVKTDNTVNIDLTNCAYDDTYTLNLAMAGATPESCTHGQVNNFDIGMDNLISVTIHGTTINVGDSAIVSRGLAGGHLDCAIGRPNDPILLETNMTVTSN